MRNFIFGVEDSLVSTVGLLSGVAVAGVPPKTIILTGVVLIFVEAISMAAGSFLSEASAEEYETGKSATNKSVFGGIVMFFSYFVAGFIPLFPYIVTEGIPALIFSISLSVVSLITLGVISGLISRMNFIASAVRMAAIGGVAIAVGVVVGILVG